MGSEPRVPRPGSALLFTLTLFVLTLLLGGFVFLAMGTSRLGFLFAALIVEIAILVTALVWIRVGGHDLRETLWLRLPSPPALLGILLVAAGAWAAGQITVVIEVVFAPEAAGYFRDFSEDLARTFEGVSLPVLLLMIAVAPAVAEEVCFRGIILSAFRRRSALVAVMVSSLLFGMFHIDVRPYRILPTAVLGILMAVAVLASRSLLGGSLIHVVNNALGVLAVEYEGVQEFIARPAVIAGASIMVIAGLVVLGMARERSRPVIDGPDVPPDFEGP